jgi:membrane associated rhomboid family serine protease
MGPSSIITLLIILNTAIFSYRGFKDEAFFARYSFEVDRVLVNKEYLRLITSGFLHVNWTHLIFNMLSLYFFSSSLESYLGPLVFLLIYFASLIGGNLFSLFIHRNHGDYSAVGASGAVCGVIFASIALFPGFGIGFFGLPAIPGWLYSILFVLFSIYGIRSRSDNIGHDAHLGGALIGMLIAILTIPAAVTYNYIPILCIFVPSIIFIYIIIKKPAFLLVDNYFFKHHYNYTLEDRYNLNKKTQQAEIDRILEKIHKRGINSLTKKEKGILNEYSKKVK